MQYQNTKTMSTKSKVALVTGGSRGLGRNMAISLAKKGIDVVLTYNSNKEEADKVVAEIQSIGQKAVAFQLNAGDVKSFDNFIKQVTAHLKDATGSTNFDFLINNAGTALYASFAETTEEQFDTALNIHYKGVSSLRKKHCRLLMTVDASSTFRQDWHVSQTPALQLMVL